jgi:hypothetical protein
MAAPGDSSDIIIKGGSVELEYDEAEYPRDNGDPKKHKNANRKVTRVVITGDISFDSGERPGGFKCDIRATCK